MAEEQKKEAAAAGAEKTKVAAKPTGKAARPTNCVVCNKSVKKTRWYYRNGKFYCTKTCWQAAIKKEKDAAAEAAASAATAAAAAQAAAVTTAPVAPAEGQSPTA